MSAASTLTRYQLTEGRVSVRTIGWSSSYGGFRSRDLDVTAIKGSKRSKKKRQITANVSGTRYDVVRQTVSNLGFVISRDDDFRNCHVIWSDIVVSTDRISELLPFQRVNHFPGMGEICRKDCLARNMAKMQKVAPNDFNMSPRTWNLPQEFSQFQSHVKDLKRKNKRKTFILKPANGAMGNGIFDGYFPASSGKFK